MECCLMSVPNQYSIIINTPPVKENFIQIEKETLYIASKLLKPKHLIVYLDLCGNQNGYRVEFSPAYYKNNYGMCKDTARGAFQEMIEKGFIRKLDGKYNFYRTPLETN